MTSGIENESEVAKAETSKGMSTAEIVVIALVILGFAALVVYQIFGCAGCYADFRSV